MTSQVPEAPLVVDASLTMAWLLLGEVTEDIKRSYVLAARVGILVPAIWRFEVINALNAAMRRKRLSAQDRDDCLADLRLLEINVDAESQSRVWAETAALMDRHRLTTYEAAYLELAIRSGSALGSMDEDLRNAAKQEGVDLLPARLPKGL